MKDAQKILKTYFDINNLHEGESFIGLHRKWENIVGTDLAAHTKPVDVREGNLIIFTDHQGWMQKLNLQKRKILSVLRRNYSDLRIKNILMKLVASEELFSSNNLQDLRVQREKDVLRRKINEQKKTMLGAEEEQDLQRKIEHRRTNKHRNIEEFEDPKLRASLERLKNSLEKN